MNLLDAAAASAGVHVPRPPSTGESTLDASLEDTLSTSYQGFYKHHHLPDQIWSSPTAPHMREASPELTTTSSPSSSSMTLEEDDDGDYSQTVASSAPVVETPRQQQPPSRTSQPIAVVTPPQQRRASRIIPFASSNAGLPGNGDAVRALQHELKFARQEIRELKQRVAQDTTAGSVTAVVDGTEGSTHADAAALPPTKEVVVQPSNERLWQRVEAAEQRATQLSRQLRESNHMAAKLYRSLKLSHVQLMTLQRLRADSTNMDMGLVVQQSQWLRGCILLGPILLLSGHVELFGVLIVLSGITLELATSY